jgi:hypothetical protein
MGVWGQRNGPSSRSGFEPNCAPQAQILSWKNLILNGGQCPPYQRPSPPGRGELIHLSPLVKIRRPIHIKRRPRRMGR